jgi:hypothetical protein
LRHLSSESIVKNSSSENGIHIFSIKTENQDFFKQKLLSSLQNSGIALELLNRNDLTLEQFFVNRI